MKYGVEALAAQQVGYPGTVSDVEVMEMGSPRNGGRVTSRKIVDDVDRVPSLKQLSGANRTHKPCSPGYQYVRHSQ
jgi:hypothetical protein